MTRTMRLETHNLQFSIPANAASKQLSEESQSVETNSTDLDFFQTCPLGSGFELDCWKNKTTYAAERKGTKSMRGNSSDDYDPDDFDWGDDSSSSYYTTAEEQGSNSTSADDGDDNGDDHDDHLTTRSGNSICPPSEPQGPKEGTREEEEPNPSAVANRRRQTISSTSIQILEPHFQAAVDHISGRHVHFGAAVVTAEFAYEKPSNDDFFQLYYSAHELQRLQDQYKNDIACSGKIHNSSDHYSSTTNDLSERVEDDSEDDIKLVDYCPDYPAW